MDPAKSPYQRAIFQQLLVGTGGIALGEFLRRPPGERL